MNFSRLQSGLLLLGCGKMGSALLQGWLRQGLPLNYVTVLEIYPSQWLLDLSKRGLHLNTSLPKSPAVCVVALKPQVINSVLTAMPAIGDQNCLFLSIAAGMPLRYFKKIWGANAAIIRAMPNTPAAIGYGISAICGTAGVSSEDMHLAQTLLTAVGKVVTVDCEKHMHAVTAVSGSGPAYVFYLIEAMTAAAIKQGLSPDLSLQLVKATVHGAASLAQIENVNPKQLRMDVTSPNGTTDAAMQVLSGAITDGKSPAMMHLLEQAIAHAAQRSHELEVAAQV